MENKNIYVLMDKNGKVTSETLRTILNNLCNDLAREHIGKALKHGFDQLKRAHAHILAYGGCELYIVNQSSSTARNIRFTVPFINQDTHDLDGYNKLFID